MPSVRYANPYNSTHFTTCCGSAILPSQEKCPICRKDIYPFYEGMPDWERKEVSGGYYNHNTQMKRDSAAKHGW